jgi:hypothetical protein
MIGPLQRAGGVDGRTGSREITGALRHDTARRATTRRGPPRGRRFGMTNSLSESLVLDDRIRGVPPGTTALPIDEVGKQSWHPAEGRMALPVLTLDERAFAENVAHTLRFVRQQGVPIAPHAKTPMAPALAARLIHAGAWGTTVADIRQAAVMLRAGRG